MSESETTSPAVRELISAVESVAFACLCSCAASNRMLLDKGFITSKKYAETIDEYADIVAETIFKGTDRKDFKAAILLLKGLAE